MQDRQDEVSAILAQIAMIAEEMNVIALEGSGTYRTHAEQLAITAEVQRLAREMKKFCEALDAVNGTSDQL
jgi:hypothetical protein